MKSGAKGIKTMVSGRLGGAEIARSRELPRRYDPAYRHSVPTLTTVLQRANTTYGVIGVKVWIYKGEVLKGEIPAQRTDETTAQTRRRNNGNRRTTDFQSLRIKEKEVTTNAASEESKVQKSTERSYDR